MINRIWMSYSRSEAVEYCCLNYFFQACGIWAVNCEEQTGSSEEEVYLSILGPDEISSIPPYFEGHIYLVKRNSTTISLRRKDVVTFKWHRAEEGFGQLMGQLFQNAEECTGIRELIKIFMQEKLWSAFWLYHEVAYEENPSWDAYISEICKKVKKQLRISKLFPASWHHRFMSLYCDYILCAVSEKSMISRSVRCSDLLNQCMELSEKSGWIPGLCILAARICRLSKLEEKYALYYYRSVMKYGDSSENLYDIGNVYEKLYGDPESAMDYYKKSWQMDRSNYRSLYKIAVDLEDRGEWMNALRRYEWIRFQLKRDKAKNSISTRKIEYEYKVQKRIIWLVKLHMDDVELLKLFQKELQALEESLRTRTDFRKLIHCMFGKEGQKTKGETEKEEEILRELQKRVMRVCTK